MEENTISEYPIRLEVCANSIDSALAAQEGGAFRVEFCDNLADGGTTPSLAQIQLAKNLLTIQLYVIIRPRGGDFLYNDLEFEIMKSEIDMCGKSGCDGVVIGILNADGTVDTNRCSQLIYIARQYSMGVTFHRAIDRSRDILKAMEAVIHLGCDRILTSGGKNSAPEGAYIIREMIEKAQNRIIIMPGAGINKDNIADLVKITGLKEFHGTFQSRYPGKMIYKNTEMKDQEAENTIIRSDILKIREVIQIANKN